MEIRVSGHQMNTGEALQMHASERLTNVVDKYFSRALSSTVTFGRAPAGAFRCDIVTHVMQGLVLKGAGIAQDAHLALDQAAEKIDKQLRRYKRRLTDRHEQLPDDPVLEDLDLDVGFLGVHDRDDVAAVHRGTRLDEPLHHGAVLHVRAERRHEELTHS